MAAEVVQQETEAPEMRMCEICLEKKPARSQFPAFSMCQHPPMSCAWCILRHARYRMSVEPNWNACVCPSCNLKVPEVEMKTGLGPVGAHYLEKYLKKGTRLLRSALHHCSTPGCTYYALVPHDMGPRLTCPKYGADSCSIHKTPWHLHYTCREFEEYLLQTDPDLHHLINFDTKPCPRCRIGSSRSSRCEADLGQCPFCGTWWSWSRGTMVVAPVGTMDVLGKLFTCVWGKVWQNWYRSIYALPKMAPDIGASDLCHLESSCSTATDEDNDEQREAKHIAARKLLAHREDPNTEGMRGRKRKVAADELMYPRDFLQGGDGDQAVRQSVRTWLAETHVPSIHKKRRSFEERDGQDQASSVEETRDVDNM